MSPEISVDSLNLNAIVRVADRDPRNRAAVLRDERTSRNLPAPVLALLEWDEESDICFDSAGARRSSEERGRAYSRLASNPRLASGEVFRHSPYLIPDHMVRSSPLWADEDFRTRFAERADGRNRPVLESLASDRSSNVRRALATSRDVPDSLVKRLTRDHDRAVAEAAKSESDRRRKEIRERAERQDQYGDWARWSLAVHELLNTHASTSVELLSELAHASTALPTARILEQDWIPGDVLTDLVADRQRQKNHVLHAVAGNRSTPPQVLRDLAYGEWGSDTAEIALRNPSLDRETLKQFATTTRRIGESEREAVWSNPSVPESLILSKPDGAAARSGIASNVAAPDFVLEKLARDRDIDVRCRVAENPATPSSALLELAGSAEKDLQYGIGGALTRNPNLPRDAVELLISHPGLRGWVAQSPRTPVDILIKLTADSDPHVRRAAGCNPSTPESVAQTLCEDQEVQDANQYWSFEASREATHRAFAEENRDSTALPRPSSPLEAAATFLRAMDSNSRDSMATHAGPFFTVEAEFILEVLAADPLPRVRSSVAHHGDEALRRATVRAEDSEDVLRSVAWSTRDPELAEALSHNQAVIASLLHNPVTPAGVLSTVEEGASSYDLELLAEHPNTTSEMLHRLPFASGANDKVGMLVAQQPRTGPHTLDRLADHASAEVRQYVAAHSRTEHKALIRLAADPNDLVRSIVAMNRHTPTTTLLGMALDANARVRQLVATNRRTPTAAWKSLVVDANAAVRVLARSWLIPEPEVRRRLASREDTGTSLLDVLADDPDLEVRLAAANNPTSGPDAIKQLSQDSEARVRSIVARRIDTSPEILHRLGQDPTWGVRRAARSSLRRRR